MVPLSVMLLAAVDAWLARGAGPEGVTVALPRSAAVGAIISAVVTVEGMKPRVAALDHLDFMAGRGQVVRRGHADDPASKNQYSHSPISNCSLQPHFVVRRRIPSPTKPAPLVRRVRIVELTRPTGRDRPSLPA